MKPLHALILALLLGAFCLSGCISFPQQPSGQQPAGGTTPVTQNISAEETTEYTIGASETGGETGAGTNATGTIRTKEISFTTSDQWKIYATLYYAKNDDGVRYPDTAIVLIHELGKDRNSFAAIVPRLHEEFPNADIIAYDVRGHGKSTNHGSYANFQLGDFRAMKNDVLALKDNLEVLRPTIQNYYIVGASIGSSVAIELAADGESSKVVMISPGIAYHDLDISEDMEDYIHEVYLTAGSDDHYSADSAEELYDVSPSDAKVLKIYYGTSAHGADLFAATAASDQPLEDLLVEWLKR